MGNQASRPGRADPSPVPKSDSGSPGAREDAEESQDFPAPDPLPFPPSREDTAKGWSRLQRWGPERETEKREEVCSPDREGQAAALLLAPVFTYGMERLSCSEGPLQASGSPSCFRPRPLLLSSLYLQRNGERAHLHMPCDRHRAHPAFSFPLHREP